MEKKRQIGLTGARGCLYDRGKPVDKVKPRPQKILQQS